MGIWYLGIDNCSSETVHVSARQVLNVNQYVLNKDMAPGKVLTCDHETSHEKAGGVTIETKVDGISTTFYIYDNDWALHIETELDQKKSITILRGYGQYKIIIENSGIKIEDVSKGDWALQLDGFSKKYYLMHPVKNTKSMESSSSMFRFG